MIQEFIQVLGRAAGQATFDVPQSGTYTAGNFRSISRAQPLLLRLATTRLPEHLLGELTSLIPSLLTNHIVNDHVGNGLAFFLRGSAPLTISQLALDSIKASAVDGPERIAQLLDNWEQGRPIPCQSHAILSGVSIDGPVDLGDGIRLEQLPRSSDALIAMLPPTVQFDLPVMDMAGAAMMIVPYQVRSALFRSSDPRIDQYDNISPSKLFTPDSFSNLCRALSLTHNTFVSWRILWSTCEYWKVLGDNRREVVWSTRSDRSHTTATLSNDSFSEAYELFRERINQERPAIDLAIGRWMESKREVGVSDQFIDLRIALEALYLGGMNDELGFRLANYGAWHLGVNFEERKEYRKILHAVYRRASEAIHASTKSFSKKDREQRANAQDLCRRGILKRLEESAMPDWNDLILGKEV